MFNSLTAPLATAPPPRIGSAPYIFFATFSCMLAVAREEDALDATEPVGFLSFYAKGLSVGLGLNQNRTVCTKRQAGAKLFLAGSEPSATP